MPQQIRDAVHRHFTFDTKSNCSQCNLCGNKLKGKHATNLKNHLATKHNDIYNEVVSQNKNVEIPNHHQVQQKTTNSKSDSLINNLKFLCIQLIAVNGRPLAMIEDEAFQKLLRLAASSELKTKEINIKAIKAMIPDVSYTIKLKVASEIQHKMISLKIDSATCQERRFLGINIQYINDGRIIVRNLAVLEVFENQTRDYIKERLIKVLNDFMIHKEQIYSITTDNDSNMRRMAKLLEGQYYTEDEVVDINNTDDDGQRDLQEDDDSSDNENIKKEQEEEQDLEQDAELSENTVNDILNHFMNDEDDTDFQIRGMLCAAHTLQHAIKDAFILHIALLEKAREVVKILRKPLNRNMIKLANLNQPVIDCPKRWTSTYNMLVKLGTLKELCQNIDEVNDIISATFWSSVDDILECFGPLNEYTLLLQREQLTIGDFYLNWMACKTQISLLDNPFAIHLKDAMESRERILLEIDCILEALYLDGRLNIVLSDEQCSKARALLKQTLNQVLKISMSENESQSMTTIEQDQPGTSNSRPTSRRFTSTSIQVIEEVLLKTERSRGHLERRVCSFDASLLELRLSSRLPLETDMIQHWSNKSVQHSDIVKVANVVLAAPATQVSVQRLFSSLKFMISPLRADLGTSLMRDILFIRSNKDLLD